jgi:aminopeptidase N
MEHATNISYPRLAAAGSLTYEAELMAHELSHHWFGDLATCRTAEDMWLNEGWATYSQSIFVEWVYGTTQYKNYRRAAHENVLHYAHINDNGYRAVSGVPHAYTYGDHVYQKGADVAATLRGYMGDAQFFGALHYHLQQSQYKDVSSIDFRDNLIISSFNTSLVDFFNDWVFSPGFPHFSIDSMTVVPNGQYWNVTTYIKQKLNHAPHYYTNVPLEITFRDAQGNLDMRSFTMSGHLYTITYTLTFPPAYSALNLDEKIEDAVIAESRTINGPGLQNLTLARCSLTVVNINDSAFVRVEHNFAPPDSIVNNFNNYRISPYRYWKIDGMLPTTFYATAKFYYDGRNTTSGGGGHLDDDLITTNGDSIILLYRRNTADDWHEWPHYTKTKIGTAATSKYGYVVVDSVALGEYAFANGVSQVLIGVNEPEVQPLSELEIFPNPSTGAFTVAYDAPVNTPCRLECYDMAGRLIMGDSVSSSGNYNFPEGTLEAGSYIFILTDGKQRLAESRCVITRN